MSKFVTTKCDRCNTIVEPGEFPRPTPANPVVEPKHGGGGNRTRDTYLRPSTGRDTTGAAMP